MTIRERLRDLIGVVRRSFSIRTLGSAFRTVDRTTPDYSYWDRARRAQVIGLVLSGLFLKPLGSKIAAWVLGQPVQWRLEDDYTQTQLQKWWNKNHATILRGYEESVSLGDCYLVVNPDLSLTLLPPNVVTAIYNPDNLGELIGWRVEEIYPSMDGTATKTTIIDEYYENSRTHIEKKGEVEMKNRNYRNPLHKLPIVHIANLFGADEEYGLPEGHALIPALQQYGDVIDAAIRGNIRQGRPTPVIEKMGTAEQVRKFWEKFGRVETHNLPDGTTERINVFDFDPDNLLVLGGDSTFKYSAPGAFAADAQSILNILFYLVVQYTEIPEFVWGNAVSASKASADAQLEPFLKWLEKKRGNAQPWVLHLADVVLGYMDILDGKVKVGSDVFFEWPPITNQAGQITLNSVIWAFTKGLIDEEAAISMLPLRIRDPRGTLERGKKAFDKRAKEALAAALAAQAAGVGGAPSNNPPGTGGNPGKNDLNATQDNTKAA